MSDLAQAAASESTAGTQVSAPWASEVAERAPRAVAAWPGRWDVPAGILPSQWLRQAERSGIIAADEPLPDDHFQPASLDLRLGARAYRIRTSFLPGDHTVDQRLRAFRLGEGIDLRSRGGGILEPNRPYLIPLMERLKLPANVRAHANPKSSTGRVDIFTRVVADHSHRFDEIPPGYEGSLWLEVFTRSFLVKVRMGMALSQLRLIVDADVDSQGGRVGGARLAIPASAPEILRIHLRSSGGEPDPTPVGYRAKGNNSTLLHLDRRNHDPRDFWEPIWPEGQIVLEPEEFYLLRSQEQVAIPSHLAAEMVPFEPTNGELRTHYAGFFDPGFGVDQSGQGLPAVLEVRAHDVPFMLEDGQEVARFRYERLAEVPDRLYGREAGSNYAGAQQWRFLSKHFGPWGQLPLRF